MEESHGLLGRNSAPAKQHDEKGVTVEVVSYTNEEKAVYEKKENDTKLGTTDGLTPAGRFVQRLLQNALVRYTIYVVPVAAILIVPVVLYANKPAQQRSIGGMNGLGLFVYVEILWVSLWIAKLVASALPILFQGVSSLFRAGTKKYALVLTATEIPLSIFIWSIMALCWFPIIAVFDTESWSAQMTKQASMRTFYDFMRASVGTAALGLLEKLSMQSIAISYHGKQHHQKISLVKSTTKALELLYEASRQKYPENSALVEDEDYIIHDMTNIQEGFNNDEKRRYLRRFFGGIHWFGEHFVTAVGRMARDISGSKEIMDLTATHAIVEGALERPKGAEALAKRIFKTLVHNGNDVLTPEDIADALSPKSLSEYDPAEIFSCLDQDGNGDVSLEEMVMLSTSLHHTRKDMWENAVNIKDAIHVLDRVLSFIVLLITIFVYATVFSDWVSKNAGSFGAALSAPAFALAQTAGEFIGACILVFVKHPYDVGDRVVLNGIEYQVVRISLLYTVFNTIAGDTISQISNSQISNMWVDNVSRSGSMKERYQFSISAGTSFQDIEKLRVELENFVRADENRRDYQSDIDIQLLSIGDMKQLDLRVEIRFKVCMNPQIKNLKLT